MRSTGPIFSAVFFGVSCFGTWCGMQAQGVDASVPRSAPPAEHAQIASPAVGPMEKQVPLPANADFWVSAKPLPDAPTPALEPAAADAAAADGAAAAGGPDHHPGER